MELTELSFVLYCIPNHPSPLTNPAVVPLSPIYLIKNSSCTHTIPGWPHASECYDHCWASCQHFLSFLPALCTHLSVNIRNW